MVNKALREKNQSPEDLKKGLKGNDVDSAQKDPPHEDLAEPPEVGEVSVEEIADGSLRDTDITRFFKEHENEYRPIDIQEYAGDGVEDDLDEEDTESPAI